MIAWCCRCRESKEFLGKFSVTCESFVLLHHDFILIDTVFLLFYLFTWLPLNVAFAFKLYVRKTTNKGVLPGVA